LGIPTYRDYKILKKILIKDLLAISSKPSKTNHSKSPTSKNTLLNLRKFQIKNFIPIFYVQKSLDAPQMVSPGELCYICFKRFGPKTSLLNRICNKIFRASTGPVLYPELYCHASRYSDPPTYFVPVR